MDTTPPVPEKFSDLIRLAIADARSLDRTCYVPSSSISFPSGDEADDRDCLVNLAGSVLVGTLGSLDRSDVRRHPSDSDYPEWSSVLITLGSIQMGEFCEAWGLHTDDLGLSTDAVTEVINAIGSPFIGTIVSDFESWEEFDSHLAGLEVVANIFEELGY